MIYRVCPRPREQEEQQQQEKRRKWLMIYCQCPGKSEKQVSQKESPIFSCTAGFFLSFFD